MGHWANVAVSAVLIAMAACGGTTFVAASDASVDRTTPAQGDADVLPSPDAGTPETGIAEGGAETGPAGKCGERSFCDGCISGHNKCCISLKAECSDGGQAKCPAGTDVSLGCQSTNECLSLMGSGFRCCSTTDGGVLASACVPTLTCAGTEVCDPNVANSCGTTGQCTPYSGGDGGAYVGCYGRCTDGG